MEVLVIFAVLLVICALFARSKHKESVPPQIDYTEQNKNQVVGWRFADPQDLRNLPPAELQAKLDLSNPLSLQLSQAKDALELLGPSPQKWLARKKKSVLEALVYEMRMRHGELREQAVQPLANNAIRNAVDGLATQMELGWRRKRQLGRREHH